MRAAAGAALLLAAAAAGPAYAQHAHELPVRVDAARSDGPLPALYRPSVMMSWADAEAARLFLSLPGRLGAVRLTLEPVLTASTSLADYRERLRRDAGHLRLLAERGATLVVTFARMPRWLASRGGDQLAGAFGFSEREASPPRDYELFAELAFETVRALNVELGLDLWYEFWNEPESKSFWGGTQDELFQAYAAFVRGARRADPKAKIGGLAVGSWNDRRAGAPPSAAPMMQAFLEFAAAPAPMAARLPVDFVSWHNFGKSPDEGWNGARELRRWLSAAGFSADTPQVVTEWNRWATFPAWMDPGRDEAAGAVYLVAALHQMRVQGVTMQTIAALQDFETAAPGSAYPGDFGLLTRRPVLKKASFHAMHMLALLGERRVALELPLVDADAHDVDVLATAGEGRVSVLISRYPLGDDVFARALNRAGFFSLAELGVDPERLAAFGQRRLELGPQDGTAQARRALERARAAAELRRKPADEVVVRLRVDGVAAGARFRIYRIDERTLDPARAYREARRQGRTHAAALEAARAQQAFTPALEGQGPIPPLRLGQRALFLVVIDGGSG